MSDDFLSRLREEPRPEFKDRLEGRLHEIDARERERRQAPSPYRRFVPALAGASLVAALALAFSLEPVRAAAREFLDLFRVKRFAAVPVDPARLERLAKGGLDFKSLVADQVEVVVAPQKPEVVASPEAGAVAAGHHRPPAERAAAATELVGDDAGAARRRSGSSVDTGKLEALALAAGADEIEIPAWWNGVTIDVEVPPVLAMRYARPVDPGDTRPAGDPSYVLMQSTIPQVDLPEGFDLATLGRLGLRVGGMSAEEALSFSRAIDWRTTLLVPVLVQGGTFREVDVAGQQGLLVTYEPPAGAATDGAARRPRRQSLLLWSTADEAFAIAGPGARAEWSSSRWRSRSGSPWPIPPSRPRRSARTSARRPRSGTSPCPCRGVRSSASWARTGRARRPRSRCSSASSARPRAGAGSSARRSAGRAPAPASATCPSTSPSTSGCAAASCCGSTGASWASAARRSSSRSRGCSAGWSSPRRATSASASTARA